MYVVCTTTSYSNRQKSLHSNQLFLFLQDLVGDCVYCKWRLPLRNTNYTRVEKKDLIKMASRGVALVTGANRGLGLAFSKALASRNVDVIAACRDPSKFPAASVPHNVEVIKLDVEKPDDIARAADHVGKTRGKLDLLVNSAGILHPTGRGETRLDDVTPEHMEKVDQISDTDFSRPFSYYKVGTK